MGTLRCVLVLLAVLYAMTSVRAAEATPRRLALLVGISEYRQSQHESPPWRRLRSSLEVENLKKILIERYEFTPSDVRLLQDKDASAAGIEAAFRSHLIEQARPGDSVLFHFSGHGQQIADDNGDELDGLDESLVPADARDTSAESGRRYNIRDDRIAQWLRQLTDRMRRDGNVVGSITVTIDACFSGDATRRSARVRGQGWVPSRDGKLPSPGANARPDGVSGLVPQGQVLEYVVLSAARSDQEAFERPTGGGYFTGALNSTLIELSSTAQPTYRHLWERVVAKVNSDADEQVPQLEGNGNAVLFGRSGPASSQPATVSVRATGGALLLDSGSIEGVTKGSRYILYKPGVDVTEPSARLGEAIVQSVATFSSVLVPDGDTERVLIAVSKHGARAREHAHAFQEEPLRVYWPQPQNCPALYAQLRRTQATTDQGATDDDHDLKVTCVKESRQVLLFRAGAKLAMATIKHDQKAADELDQRLRGACYWRHLYRLRGLGSDVQVILRLLASAAGDAPVGTAQAALPGTFLRVRKGEYVRFEVTKLSPRPLFITLLYADDRGMIEPLYPGDGDQANRIVDSFTPWSPKEILPKAPGRYLLKLVATTEPVDFRRALLDSGASETRGASTSTTRALDRLISAWQSTPSTRGAGPTDWGTAEAWLEVSAN